MRVVGSRGTAKIRAILTSMHGALLDKQIDVLPALESGRTTIGEVQKESQPMKPETFKNAEEFTRYIEGLTGKRFNAAASTDGTTAHQYLSGQRDYAKLFTDPDLIAILDDKHPDGGLLLTPAIEAEVMASEAASA